MDQPVEPRCVDPYAHRFEFDVRDTLSGIDANMIERLRWCWQCRATVDVTYIHIADLPAAR